MLNYSDYLLIIIIIQNVQANSTDTIIKKCGQSVSTNVGLILDSSASIESDWPEIRTTAANFVSILQDNSHAAKLIRFGIISFADTVEVYRRFDQSVTPDDVRQLPLIGTRTNTHLALGEYQRSFSS
jgi:hypothetical protein